MRGQPRGRRSEEHTSELQSHVNIVCRLLLEKKNRYAASVLDWHREDADRELERVDRWDGRPAPLILCESRSLAGVLRDIFFFNDTATTEIYTLSLHDALPI